MEKQTRDDQVLAVQIWVNETYGDKIVAAGYELIEENGKTSWDVTNGLIMGLQIELGIEDIAPSFGDTTTVAMNAYGPIGEGINDANVNINKIIDGGCWCTGIDPGLVIGEVINFDSGMTKAMKELQVDIGIEENGVVDSKLMKALLSMNVYTLYTGGTVKIRMIQQWLNKTYGMKTAFDYLSTSGLYTANTQKGIVYGIQYECGMDDVANGVFGPSTKAKLELLGFVHKGDSDTISGNNFVHLFKAIFICQYDSPVEFDGEYDEYLVAAISVFQKFTAITVDGQGTYETWCELLVSTGDEKRTTKAFDCSANKISADRAIQFSKSYTTVGRYLKNLEGGTLDKELEHVELYNIMNEGLSIFLIHQMYNSTLDAFSYEYGQSDAIEGLGVAINKFNFSDTTIYFPVDFDAYDYEVESNIIPYFKGVCVMFADSSINTNNLRPEIYGARNTCKLVSDAIASDPEHYPIGIEKSFVSGMSTGYSGNLAFPLPDNWVYNQIAEDYFEEIDHDVMRFDVNDEREDSIKSIPVSSLRYKWCLVRMMYVANGDGEHPFLDPDYRGYESPGGR